MGSYAICCEGWADLALHGLAIRQVNDAIGAALLVCQHSVGEYKSHDGHDDKEEAVVFEGIFFHGCSQ
jgi:hypothetical protein